MRHRDRWEAIGQGALFVALALAIIYVINYYS